MCQEELSLFFLLSHNTPCHATLSIIISAELKQDETGSDLLLPGIDLSSADSQLSHLSPAYLNVLAPYRFIANLYRSPTYLCHFQADNKTKWPSKLAAAAYSLEFISCNQTGQMDKKQLSRLRLLRHRPPDHPPARSVARLLLAPAAAAGGETPIDTGPTIC